MTADIMKITEIIYGDNKDGGYVLGILILDIFVDVKCV
jgi:hypothetical protein